jgi:drug/metabolite transporter (DMT)-like permease
MPIGVLLALLAYSTYSVGDSIIKSVGTGSMSVFELGVFINLFALISAPFARTRGDRWAEIFRYRHPVLMNARAFLYTVATILFTYSVTSIPLAETYSLAFLAPLFLTFLSAVVLKEKVPVSRALLVALSFVGVLIVVRPGFREIGLGHIAALGCAITAASSNTILRIISNRERQVSIIVLNGVYQIVLNAGLMLFSGFVVPTLADLVLLAVVGLLYGTAQILFIRGMARAPASHIGPTQYVQILWGVVIGAIFFGEHQDLVGYTGLVLLVVAGVATIFSDGAQARISGRWAEFRARRGEPVNNRVEGPDL